MTNTLAAKGALPKVIAMTIALCFIMANPTDKSRAIASENTNENDILIVVNKNVSVNELKINTVRDYFLKYRTHWSATQKVFPINSSNAALRNDFRAKVLKMSRAEEERYWRDVKVKGTLREPIVVLDTLRAVFKVKGALSYVYRRDFKKGVSKVVLVIPAKRLP